MAHNSAIIAADSMGNVNVDRLVYIYISRKTNKIYIVSNLLVF